MCPLHFIKLNYHEWIPERWFFFKFALSILLPRKGKSELSQVTLRCSTKICDLGVTINYNLSWGKHVSYKVNKANKVLDVIERSLGNDNWYAFSCLFKSLVRPILEYAATVWSPYQKNDIESLKQVQRASWLALEQKRREMSYEDPCHLLNWQTLEKRREFLSLVQCYKIDFGIGILPFLDFF